MSGIRALRTVHSYRRCTRAIEHSWTVNTVWEWCVVQRRRLDPGVRELRSGLARKIVAARCRYPSHSSQPPHGVFGHTITKRQMPRLNRMPLASVGLSRVSDGRYHRLCTEYLVSRVFGPTLAPSDAALHESRAWSSCREQRRPREATVWAEPFYLVFFFE